MMNSVALHIATDASEVDLDVITSDTVQKSAITENESTDELGDLPSSLEYKNASTPRSKGLYSPSPSFLSGEVKPGQRNSLVPLSTGARRVHVSIDTSDVHLLSSSAWHFIGIWLKHLLTPISFFVIAYNHWCCSNTSKKAAAAARGSDSIMWFWLSYQLPFSLCALCPLGLFLYTTYPWSNSSDERSHLLQDTSLPEVCIPLLYFTISCFTTAYWELIGVPFDTRDFALTVLLSGQKLIGDISVKRAAISLQSRLNVSLRSKVFYLSSFWVTLSHESQPASLAMSLRPHHRQQQQHTREDGLNAVLGGDDIPQKNTQQENKEPQHMDSDGDDSPNEERHETGQGWTQRLTKHVAEGKVSIDVLWKQIVLSTNIELATTHSRPWKNALLCLVTSLVLAILPHLDRVLYSQLHFPGFDSTRHWQASCVMLCYIISCFFFITVYLFYSMQSVLAYTERTLHMRGVKALLDSRANSFVVPLPCLDPWQPSHLIALSKLRLFLLTFRVESQRKYETLFGFLFLPSMILLIVLLTSRAVFIEERVLFIIGVFNCILWFTRSLITARAAIKANSEESSHTRYLINAKFRVSHRIAEVTSQGEDTTELIEGHRLITDLIHILEKTGLSNKLMGVQIDDEFLMKFITLVITLTATQVTNSLLSSN